MSKDKVNMPASTAGITRYFDDYQSKLEISPWVVVGACVGVALIIILVHVLGSGFLA